jgi:hypothetical protein
MSIGWSLRQLNAQDALCMKQPRYIYKLADKALYGMLSIELHELRFKSSKADIISLLLQ